MASKKHLVLSVLQNQITLPEELIPKNVSMFGYEVQFDGKIILTPLSTKADVPPDVSSIPDPKDLHADLENVIDFQSAQVRLKNRKQKKHQAPSLSKSAHSPERGGEFVVLHLFSSRMEAEMVGEILRQGDIPFLIHSEDIGIFGPGASPVPGGARIAVRKADHQDAKSLLSGLI